MAHRVRRVIIGAASVTLLAGTGALAVNQGLLKGPAAAEPHLVTAKAVCGWDSAATDSGAHATIASVTGDLVLPVGASVPYRVRLTNEDRPELEVPSGSAPVLVATLGVDPVVVGFAAPSYLPEARTLRVGEVFEHADFGAFVACPGEPTAADGVHLPKGSYELHAAQALGWSATGRSAPFNAWARLGRVSITNPLGRGGTQPLAEPPAPAGTCGSSLDGLPQASNHLATFEQLDPVLAVVGSTLDTEVRITNHGPVALKDALQGGPALLVAQDGAVVARSQSLDALPGPALGVGQSLSVGSFAALTDCRTEKPLDPGVYEYAVAQQARGPETIAPFGAVARGGALAVTPMTGAVRAEVAVPVLPACGDPADSFTFDAGFAAGTVAYVGRIEQDLATGEILRDAPGGAATVEVEATYTGPERAVRPRGHHAVLVRDGVVVARSERVIESAPEVLWPTGTVHVAALDGWTDCAAPTAGTELEPAGEYTVLGFVQQGFTDEWGLPARHVTTLPPSPITFTIP